MNGQSDLNAKRQGVGFVPLTLAVVLVLAVAGPGRAGLMLSESPEATAPAAPAVTSNEAGSPPPVQVADTGRVHSGDGTYWFTLQQLDIGGTTAVSQHDVFAFSGTQYLAESAGFRLQLINGHQPQEGNQYRVFDFESDFVGFVHWITQTPFGFSNFDTSQAQLSGTLVWDFRTVNQDGIIRVIEAADIPEPASMALLVLGGYLVVSERRLRRR